MGIGYRAILGLDDMSDAIEIAENQSREWVTEKHSSNTNGTLDVVDWDGDGEQALGPNARLSVTRVNKAEHESQLSLFRLTEINDGGTWTLSLYAISLPNAMRGRQQSLVLEAELSEASVDEAISKIKTPPLVKNLLGAFEVRDGSTRLTCYPTLIREGSLDEVLCSVADQDRRTPVVVASSPGRDKDGAWREIVADLTSGSVGVASAYVISADSANRFNSLLPASHRVAPGQIRTFLPHVALGSLEDGVRHRIIVPRALAGAGLADNRSVSRDISAHHESAMRRRLIELALPNDIQHSVDVLIAEEAATQRDASLVEFLRGTQELIDDVDEFLNRLRRDDATRDGGDSGEIAGEVVEALEIRQAPRDPEQVPFAEEIEDLIRYKDAAIKIAEKQTDDLLEAQVRLDEEMRNLNEAMQNLRDDLEESRFAAALDAREAVEERRRAQYFRKRLIEAQNYEALLVPDDPAEWRSPESIDELLARLTAGGDMHPVQKWVEFCGDRGAALEVQKRDPFGKYANQLWTYSRVLYDYAEARNVGYGGTVHAYLTEANAPEGEKCSAERHAAFESETVVNGKWGRERVLPVPKAVDPSGRIAMWAHFKTTHDSQFAPRMHYLDDTSTTGKIYIGYIGRHLTNTKTS